MPLLLARGAPDYRHRSIVRADRTLPLDGSLFRAPEAFVVAITCEGIARAGRIVEAGKGTARRRLRRS